MAFSSWVGVGRIGQAGCLGQRLLVRLLADVLQPDSSQCRGGDARKARTSETVCRNGYGTYKYSIRNPDQVEYFKVNRRFASVFESVGLSNPNSTLASLIDNSIRNPDRVGVTELVQGTRALMQRIDKEGCGSPLMQRMEANMLSYFEQYRERNREVMDASLGRTR
jgi:hypothetical protein